MKTLAIGDKVAYSVQWLKSIGASHSNLARARGTITVIDRIGDRLQVARIVWQDDDIPVRVNVKNLALVGPNVRFCNVD